MHKTFTFQKKSDLITEKKKLEKSQSFQPKEETLQKILKFASAYRVEKIIENQYIEWYLN